jgi:hypothetical protein
MQRVLRKVVTFFQVVVATGTIFGVMDAIKEQATIANGQESFYLLSASTLQGISAVMFTNSAMSFIVDSISYATLSSTATLSSIGLACVSVAAGIVSSRLIVLLLGFKEKISQKRASSAC